MRKLQNREVQVALEMLLKHAPTQEFRDAARYFQSAILAGWWNIDQEDLIESEVGDALLRAGQNLPKKYQQPTFQCYEDY